MARKKHPDNEFDNPRNHPHFIQGAIKHPGGLHRALHVPEGEKIPAAKMQKAMHSRNPRIRKMANFAKTLKGLPRHHGPRRKKK